MFELFFLQRSFRILKTGANVLVLGRYQVYYNYILLKKLHTVNYLSVSRRYVTSQHCCLQTGISNCLPSQANLDTSYESVIDEFGENLKGVESKIIFNSVLQSKKVNRIKQFVLKDREAKEKLKRINDKDPISNIPIALKYMLQGSETSTSEAEENTAENILENEIVQLPYRVGTELNKTVYNVGWQDSSEDEKSRTDSSGQSMESNHNNNDESQFHPSVSSLRERLSEPKFSNWMIDYECYDEYEDESGDQIIKSERPWQFNYGTPKRNVPASKVPCGGCGALLHCRDTAIPGYLPSEIFEQQDKVTLRSTVCQRCHFLRVYNTALNVIVSPDDYPKLLGHVRDKMALIILMTDLLDFPCSIWPGIIEIVGDKHPIVVVGNKVDLLPPDSRGYLHRIEECLVENLKLSGIPARSIKHVALISAKTGYGVEELITKLHNLWKYKGDVYVVGCTNVGKSTLFNALLQSDYCKVKAVDLVQRATTSPWPGTTINLLKFPILRPSDWRLYERTQRILSQRQQIQAQRRLHKDQLKEDKFKARPALIGHIGMTFYKKDPIVSKDLFSMGRVNQGPTPLSGLDPADEKYAQSKWCYDTPGAVHPDQVLHLLTTEELMLALPKKLLLPKTFRMKPSMTLFIAGLGRLDYIQGDGPIKMTVFVPKTLPMTICQADDADSLYEALVGSKLMAVPCGGPDRMAQWPGLKARPYIIQLQGIDWKTSCADILLSSAGWIAITLGKDKKCEFRAWTPGGRGVYVRQPALLPFAVNFSGPKVRASPAYRMGPGMYTAVQ